MEILFQRHLLAMILHYQPVLQRVERYINLYIIHFFPFRPETVLQAHSDIFDLAFPAPADPSQENPSPAALL